MTDDGLTIQVYGLNDPEADLILVGQCNECGAQVWRRQYAQEDFAGMSATAILLQIKDDVKADRDRSQEHECLMH